MWLRTTRRPRPTRAVCIERLRTQAAPVILEGRVKWQFGRWHAGIFVRFDHLSLLCPLRPYSSLQLRS